MAIKNIHTYVYVHPDGQGHSDKVDTIDCGTVTLLHGQIVFFKALRWLFSSTVWEGSTFDPVRAQWILKAVPWARDLLRAYLPPKDGQGIGANGYVFSPGNDDFKGTFISIDRYNYLQYGPGLKHKESGGSIYNIRHHIVTEPQKLYKYDKEEDEMIEEVALPEYAQIIIGEGQDYVLAKTFKELTTWKGQYQRVWGYIPQGVDSEGLLFPLDVVKTEGLYIYNKVSRTKDKVHAPTLDHYIINTY